MLRSTYRPAATSLDLAGLYLCAAPVPCKATDAAASGDTLAAAERLSYWLLKDSDAAKSQEAV